jgi:cystathionine gamma-synthase
VSLPTWDANVGYEEGEDWVVSKMNCGYPRFFVHPTVENLAREIAQKHLETLPDCRVLLFPTVHAAQRCLKFIEKSVQATAGCLLGCVEFVVDPTHKINENFHLDTVKLTAVVCAPHLYSTAREYWQHTGDGISSRRAEFLQELFYHSVILPSKEMLSHILETGNPGSQGGDAERTPSSRLSPPLKGPRRYHNSIFGETNSCIDAAMSNNHKQLARHKSNSPEGDFSSHDESQFLEERFGRNLDVALAARATVAIKRRLAGAISAECSSAPSHRDAIVDEQDIYLFPCGMNAIFNIHRCVLQSRGSMQSIVFGFPYVDTLKLLQKFGPGCIFYGNGADADLDDLQLRLEQGQRFAALYCEVPGNPLLSCPNLPRISALASTFDFAVIVDDTIGNIANINVMPFADVVVSSLTKVFSGESNVMGGSLILNPNGRYHDMFRALAISLFEDNYWPQDVIFMERNSRDYRQRICHINTNAEAICEKFKEYPDIVKRIYYPKYNASRSYYDICRRPDGGYGGLISVTFHHPAQAKVFFDCIQTAKGPSLGTNFTLTSPYVLLAHYKELAWASRFGLEPYLIRISVGLEPTSMLTDVFDAALRETGKA